MKLCSVCVDEWLDSSWMLKGHIQVCICGDGCCHDIEPCETCNGTGELADDHELASDLDAPK